MYATICIERNQRYCNVCDTGAMEH